MIHNQSDGAPALRDALVGLRSRAKRVLLVRAGSMVSAAVLVGLLAGVLLDFLLRLPSGARWVLLIGGLVGVAWMLRAWVLRAALFAPSLTAVALRVERGEHGKGVRGSLASALELASDQSADTDDPTSASLTAKAISDAGEALKGVRVDQLIRTEPARRGVIALAMALLIAGGGAVASPALASIGLTRLLTPWSQTHWPKRTGVVAALNTGVHAAGEPIVLRALLTKTNRAFGQSDVDVKLRVVRDGKAEPWRTLPLSPQRREATSGETTGEVYERLTETPMLERDALLEYRFVSADDQTDVQQLTLAPRPRLVGVSVRAEPPEYAVRAGVTGVLAGKGVELDAGSRVVSAPSPVLAGSDVTLALRFNKPLPKWTDAAEVARSQLGDESLAGSLSASDDGATWTLTLQPKAQVVLAVMPEDSHGLTPATAATVRLEVIQDEPPAIAIIEPSRDEAVLATALIDVLGEGRDDIGLEEVSLVAQRARAPAGSTGAEAESIGDETLLASEGVAGALVGQARIAMALEEFGATAGDEVWLWALASDVFEVQGQSREPTRSAKRVLRIIDESELEAQVRGELSAVRRAAMRLEGQQRELRDRVAQEPADPKAEARQEALTRRIEAQQAALDRLGERLDRNQMDDSPLAGLLDDAGSIVREAAEASEQAQRELDAQQNEDEQDARDEATERAQQSQEEVRAALSDLIAALDRGEDAWVARRGVEQLLEEQRDIAEQTAQLGQRTTGRTVEQLTQAERTELERILERQQRAADAGREAIEELDRRADQLAGRDPAQASALRDAASRGRSSQLEQRQNDAAQNLGQNQTADAGGNQQQAIEALEQMLDEIDNADERRDEVLRRILASLIESIDALIVQQQDQLERLARAEGDEVKQLDDGMIRLDANTLAVIQLAGEAPGDVAQLIAMLSGAQGEQVKAVQALRSGNGNVAAKREARSLELLEQAKAEAERLEEEAQQREQDRRLAELQDAYRDLLERQVVLQSEVDEFVGKEVTRRERAKVRGLGEQQLSLTDDLTAVRETNSDIEDTLVFTLALDRMDSASADAAERLRRGNADRGAQRGQATVARLLRSILEALKDDRPEQDEFGEGAQESGGGGGGAGGEQPLVPPVAELKLLRAMQIEAAEWTRAANEDGAETTELDQLAELQRELAERGQQLIEQLQQATPQPSGGTQIEPRGGG